MTIIGLLKTWNIVSSSYLIGACVLGLYYYVVFDIKMNM